MTNVKKTLIIIMCQFQSLLIPIYRIFSLFWLHMIIALVNCVQLVQQPFIYQTGEYKRTYF